MKDYGGFGEESFYDLDGNGDLDILEQAFMHTEQDFEMMEMANDPFLSNSDSLASSETSYSYSSNYVPPSPTSSAKTPPTSSDSTGLGCGLALGLFLIAVLFMWLGVETGIGIFFIIPLIIMVVLGVCDIKPNGS